LPFEQHEQHAVFTIAPTTPPPPNTKHSFQVSSTLNDLRGSGACQCSVESPTAMEEWHFMHREGVKERLDFVVRDAGRRCQASGSYKLAVGVFDFGIVSSIAWFDEHLWKCFKMKLLVTNELFHRLTINTTSPPHHQLMTTSSSTHDQIITNSSSTYHQFIINSSSTYHQVTTNSSPTHHQVTNNQSIKVDEGKRALMCFTPVRTVKALAALAHLVPPFSSVGVSQVIHSFISCTIIIIFFNHHHHPQSSSSSSSSLTTPIVSD
jgi:hypothetical protein